MELLASIDVAKTPDNLVSRIVDTLLIKTEDLEDLLLQKIQDLYYLQQEVHWNEKEIHASDDLNDWANLDQGTKNPIIDALTLTASVDKIVKNNIEEKLLKNLERLHQIPPKYQLDCKTLMSTVYSKNSDFERNAKKIEETFVDEVPPQIISCFNRKTLTENTHWIVYSDFINTLFTHDEKIRLLQTISTRKSISLIYKFMTFYDSLDGIENLPFQNLAFAVAEAISFLPSFTLIQFLRSTSEKHHSVMTNLTTSNEFTFRDEAIHGNLGIVMKHYIDREFKRREIPLPDDSKLIDIIKDVTEISKMFICETMKNSTWKNFKFTVEDLCQFLEFRANNFCKDCGIMPWRIYPNSTSHKIECMDVLKNKMRSNFFERHHTEYKNNICDTVDYDEIYN